MEFGEMEHGDMEFGEMEFAYEDCKSLLEQVNLQEKELRRKRRWLMGSPISQNEDGKLKASKFKMERTMPECLLREEDVSYETIKSFIEKGVEGCETSKNKYHIVEGNMQLIHSPGDVKGIHSLIDNMTNEGLFRFAEVLTGGLVKFEKTRWKMKQTIKGCLSECNTQQMTLLLSEDHSSSLLKNPHNYRWSSESRFIPDSKFSYHAAVVKMLDVLEDLPTQTLFAMHRKLRGTKSYIPRLIPKKSAWGRDKLIKRLRKKCMGLLSIPGEGDSLQEPLAKAMEVAGLTLKLIKGCHYVTNFKQFSPEINDLQNELAMCIQLLDERVTLSELKDIQLVLDPDPKVAKLSDRSLRVLLRNLLTEYLLECSDMDTIPKCLLQVLAIIKKSLETPYKKLSDMKIEEEVECILTVSASTKQILWDLMVPEHELDLDFADAYMEDLEESDCEHMSHSRNSYEDEEEVASTGEMQPANSYSLNSQVPNSQDKDAMPWYHLVSLRNTDTDSLSSSPDRLLRSNINLTSGDNQNQYLSVQAASDETSMVAYRLIGHMLDSFAQIQRCELNSSDVSYLGGTSCDSKQKNHKVARKGLTIHVEDGCSIMIKAVEEIIPSFTKSETERLKEVMGSKVERKGE